MIPLKRKKEMSVEVGDGGRAGSLGAGRFAGQMELGLDLREGEGYRAGIAMKGQGIDPGTAGVAQAEQLGHLVEGFAGGVVQGAADERSMSTSRGLAGQVKVSVAAGDDQR